MIILKREEEDRLKITFERIATDFAYNKTSCLLE